MLGMLAGAAGGGGGLSASASSSATSGPATQGDVGVYVGGIQTGGSSGGVPAWALMVGGAIVVGLLLVMRKR